MSARKRPNWQVRAYLLAKGLWLHMTVGARCVLVDGDRILLIRHTYAPGWGFPGGGVQPGETLEQGARREVLEETGHMIDGPMDLFGVYLSTEVTNRDHVGLFVARDFHSAAPFRKSLEIAECGWFDWRDPPRDTSDGTRRRIAEIFRGAERSPIW